jgi:hypothetical protein
MLFFILSIFSFYSSIPLFPFNYHQSIPNNYLIAVFMLKLKIELFYQIQNRWII